MIDYKEVKRNSADFSLTKIVADNAMNGEFKAGYLDLLNNKETEKSFLWYSLSAIGQMVGETIYENVLNYIDNVSNIDLCHVKALKSIVQVLGITNKTMLNHVDRFPIDVLNMMDVFSLNKRYLKDASVINENLVKDLKDYVLGSSNIQLTRNYNLTQLASENVTSDISGLIDIDIGYDQTKYESYITLAFFNLLKSKLEIEYEPGDLVMENLSNDLASDATYSFGSYDLDSPYRSAITYLETRYNTVGFNPFKVANDIEDGKDSLDNYGAEKLDLLKRIFEYRSREKYVRYENESNNHYIVDRPLTKYSYYKEKELIEYLKFIEMEYINGAENIYNLISSTIVYDLDTNYSEILSRDNTSNRVLLSDSKERNLILYSVAVSLKDTCMAIADIREKLKTQAQKNHMRGTFLLLSYVINQYLKKNLPIQYPELKSAIESDEFQRNQNYSPLNNEHSNVEIQEYWDTTEYYNLCVDTTQYAKNAKEVNAPFWLASDDDASGIGFAISEIDKFYLSTLNLKSSVDKTMDFLQVVYNLGADRTYVDRETSAIVVPEETDRLDLEILKDPSLSAQYLSIEKYQRELFLKYSGMEIGYDPCFNWKNQTHSSYQIHPYLYKFVQKTNIQQSIKNAFYNDANKELIAVMLSPQISVHLGELGNWLNIWKDNTTDYSGYRSRYEDNTHNVDTNYGMLSPLQHYDGVFYPSAIDEYMGIRADRNKFLEMLLTVGNRYSSSYLTTTLRKTTNNPLSNYIDVLSDYVNYNNELDYLWGILSDTASLSSLPEAKVESLSARYDELKNSGPKKTFYDKWYSHLGLSEKDAQYISAQLSVHEESLYDIYRSRPLDEETFDVSKYCLDKYSNSLLLYKKYNLSSRYIEKQNTLGELWIRFNAHPIGFPAFGSDKNYPQVRNENINHLLKSYIKEDTSRLCMFYDMDCTSDYRYVSLAYPKDDQTSSLYDDSNVMVVRPWTDPQRYYMESDHVPARELDYYEMRAIDDIGTKVGYVKDNSYSFQGFYQDYDKINAIYTFYDNLISTLTVKTVQLPTDDAAGYRFKNGNVAGDKLTFTDNETSPGVYIGTNVNVDSIFKVGYVNGLYTVAFLADLENAISASTYIGMNSTFTPEDTSLASISGINYGRSHYDTNAVEVEHQYNSFDRFNTYLTLFDYSDLDYSKTYYAKRYNLNPDASYIPLYAGLYGQIRIWANDYYKSRLEQSIELLGYSHNGLPAAEEAFSALIYEDENGVPTLEDPTAFLSTICRVYEQYDETKFFTHYETPVLRPVTETGIDNVLEWTFDLTANITPDTISNYFGIMYNVKRGARNPIASGPLSAFDAENYKRILTYLSSLTKFDEYFLSNRYVLSDNAVVVGTPAVFNDDFNSIQASNNTNAIFNVSGVAFDLKWNDESQRYQMSVLFERTKPEEDFIIDQNDVTFMAYQKNCGEYENYHMMWHHNTWPYLSMLLPSQMSVELSNYMTLDDVEVLSAGTIVFKINEDTDARITKYPGRLIDDYMIHMLSSVNKSFISLSNVFDLSNTYIFELEKPKKIADILGTLSIGIYSDTDECVRVYEDYISDMYSVSKYENDILPYYHFLNEEGLEPSWIDDNIAIVKEEDLERNKVIYKLSTSWNSEEIYDLSESLSDLGEHGLSVKIDDVFPIPLVDSDAEYTVTEEDVQDFLKLYVNFAREPDTNEITLFFNYNNLFSSPYVYKNPNGVFATVFKPKTWLKLKSGENGILNVEIQVRYFNNVGSIVGYKDIPVLTYRIYNVSDDKPKFVIVNTWTISKENMKPVQGKAIENKTATLLIHDTVIDASKLSILNDDCTLATDLTATAQVEINTNSTVQNATCDFYYDYSDPDIEFLMERSSGGRFAARNGVIHMSTGMLNQKLGFKLRKGSSIDDETLKKEIAIGALDFTARDENGVKIDSSVIPGSLVFDFSGGGDPSGIGRYLAKELGSNPSSEKFKGFILTENYKLVRIYQNKLFSFFQLDNN